MQQRCQRGTAKLISNTHPTASAAAIHFAEPPRQTAHSFKHEESPGERENEPYFSASSSNMNMNIVPGAITFQNIDEMTKVRWMRVPNYVGCIYIYYIFL